MKNRIIAAAACLDDLASGTLGLEDTLREQAAAKEHVAMLYRLADALDRVPKAVRVLEALIE